MFSSLPSTCQYSFISKYSYHNKFTNYNSMLLSMSFHIEICLFCQHLKNILSLKCRSGFIVLSNAGIMSISIDLTSIFHIIRKMNWSYKNDQAEILMELKRICLMHNSKETNNRHEVICFDIVYS